jgi:hypothetical protein
MFAFLRALPVLPVILLTSAIHLCAQDVLVRVEAVRLLERAKAVSRAANVMPNYKLEGTFSRRRSGRRRSKRHVQYYLFRG